MDKQLWIDMQNSSINDLNGVWSIKPKAEPLPYLLTGPIILALSILSWAVFIIPLMVLSR